jgi:branched-chain amino acid aminotransferase
MKRANGFREAIALEVDGLLSEGSGQNVFLVSNGTVITPPVADALAGITRETVLSLTSDLRIPVHEQPIPRG